MHAVAWTDALQGVLMMVGLGALLHWLLAESDGFGPLASQILEVRPGAADLPDAREQINGFSTIVLVGLASVVYPAGDPAHLRGAAWCCVNHLRRCASCRSRQRGWSR